MAQAKETQEKITPVAPTIKRTVIGSIAFIYLENQDPSRHYVVVNRADGRARAEYEARGYIIERYRDGGVRPMGVAKENIKNGEPIETLEGFVMSCDAEEKKTLDQQGVDIMKRVAQQIRGSQPQISGLNPRYFRERTWTVDEGSIGEHGEISV